MGPLKKLKVLGPVLVSGFSAQVTIVLCKQIEEGASLPRAKLVLQRINVPLLYLSFFTMMSGVGDSALLCRGFLPAWLKNEIGL